MAEFPQSIALAELSAQGAGDTDMSRNKLLDWINKLVQGNYVAVEELNSGVAYLQILKRTFPSSLQSLDIKDPATVEQEKLHNLQLLQTALDVENIEKVVPVEDLLNAGFQENLDFLKWFSEFHAGCLKAKEAEVKKNKPTACIAPILHDDSPTTEDIEARFERIVQRHLHLQMHCDTINNILFEMEKDLKEQMERGENIEFCERVLEAMNSDNLADTHSEFGDYSDSDNESEHDAEENPQEDDSAHDSDQNYQENFGHDFEVSSYYVSEENLAHISESDSDVTSAHDSDSDHVNFDHASSDSDVTSGVISEHDSEENIELASESDFEATSEHYSEENFDQVLEFNFEHNFEGSYEHVLESDSEHDFEASYELDSEHEHDYDEGSDFEECCECSSENDSEPNYEQYSEHDSEQNFDYTYIDDSEE